MHEGVLQLRLQASLALFAPEPIWIALFFPRDTASVWQFSLRQSLTKRYFWDFHWHLGGLTTRHGNCTKHTKVISN